MGVFSLKATLCRRGELPRFYQMPQNSVDSTTSHINQWPAKTMV